MNEYLIVKDDNGFYRVYHEAVMIGAGLHVQSLIDILTSDMYKGPIRVEVRT